MTHQPRSLADTRLSIADALARTGFVSGTRTITESLLRDVDHHLNAALAMRFIEPKPDPRGVHEDADVLMALTPAGLCKRPGDLLMEAFVYVTGPDDLDPVIWGQIADHYAKLLAQGAPPLPVDTPTSDDDASTGWLLGQAIRALEDLGREPDAPVGSWQADRALRMGVARMKVEWLKECLNGDRQPCITEDCRPAHEPLRFKHVVGVDAGSERAVEDVVGERRRQLASGHTLEGDDLLADRELARAAAAYALFAGALGMTHHDWARRLSPWVVDVTATDARELLVMSAALAIAEIERMDRAAEASRAFPGVDGLTRLADALEGGATMAERMQAASDAAQAEGDRAAGWDFVGTIDFRFSNLPDPDLRADSGELPCPPPEHWAAEIDTGHGIRKPEAAPPRVRLVMGSETFTYVLDPTS